MRKILYILFLLIPAIPLHAQIAEQSVATPLNMYRVLYEDGRIFVKLNSFTNDGKPGGPDNLTPALQKIFNENQVVKFTPISTRFPELANIYSLTFSDPNRVEQLINDLRLLQEVNYAERIPVPIGDALPNDVIADKMWYLKKIQMEQSWNFINTGTKVTIAIVDNGVRLSHEDIQDNLWTNPGEIAGNNIDDDNNGYVDDIHGYDVADGDGNPNVPLNRATNTFFTHGTHVAGLASASTGNSVGTVSVGINTEIIAVKVVKDLENNDTRFVSAYDGILYAVAAGAQVINLSWSHTATSQTMRDIVAMAIDRGCIIVAAAGNGSSEQPSYPGAYPGVICVGATEGNDSKATFSNYGSYITVMAPGRDIYSTLAGGDQEYNVMSGTSQATPIVSGFIGLILSQYPELRDSIEYFLRLGCDNIDLDNGAYMGKLGSGRINIDRTFQMITKPTLSVDRVLHQDINVYPNPSSGRLFFQGSLAVQTMEIYDLSGKLVLSREVTNQQVDINDAALKGLYMVKLVGPEGTAVSRIVFH